MNKATAKAYANIALVKYWGKKDQGLRLPTNPSMAIGLDSIFTVTTVEFQEGLGKDVVEIDGDTFNEEETKRVSDHLDMVRETAGIRTRARVVTKNNFPKAVGAASSASGFAALSLAAAKAAGLELGIKELSILARIGSGSASRSVPGGFSIWHTGEKSEDSYAERIEHPTDWDLRVLLVFVGGMEAKKIGSTEGMELSRKTSPYYEMAVKEAFGNIEGAKRALEQADFEGLGKVIEDECYRLHTLCMTTDPNILYWTRETVDIFQRLLKIREAGVRGYFTVDAGPHVHVVCMAKDEVLITKELEKVEGVRSIVTNKVGEKAHLIEEHLF